MYKTDVALTHKHTHTHTHTHTYAHTYNPPPLNLHAHAYIINQTSNYMQIHTNGPCLCVWLVNPIHSLIQTTKVTAIYSYTYMKIEVCTACVWKITDPYSVYLSSEHCFLSLHSWHFWFLLQNSLCFVLQYVSVSHHLDSLLEAMCEENPAVRIGLRPILEVRFNYHI